MEEHTDDLRNVNEGDSVTLDTTENETFNVTCTERLVQQAAPETREVRETRIWVFENNHRKLAASIIDGLRSSPDGNKFPQHSELWDMTDEENMGYVEQVFIHGKVEA